MNAMPTTVVNIYKNRSYDVYIGRGSIWGNPFHQGADGNRYQVVAKYRSYILNRPDLLAKLPTLKGKILGCYCKPLMCHGDVLVELLREMEKGEINSARF